MSEKRQRRIFSQLQGGRGISARRVKANPPISPFFKGGFEGENLFKDKLLATEHSIREEG
jgi:hypothetical protein